MSKIMLKKEWERELAKLRKINFNGDAEAMARYAFADGVTLSMHPEMDAVCRFAIARLGKPHQMMKSVEEMGELISALCHYKDCRVANKDVITEIADVFITLRQLAIIFGVEDVNKEIEFKVERLRENLKNEE